MQHRELLLVVLLASAIAAITPLSYADLPDQIWLRGLFDGGDEDDAILDIQTNRAATEPALVYVAASAMPRGQLLVLPPYAPFLPLRAVSLDLSRGPPAS